MIPLSMILLLLLLTGCDNFFELSGDSTGKRTSSDGFIQSSQKKHLSTICETEREYDLYEASSYFGLDYFVSLKGISSSNEIIVRLTNDQERYNNLSVTVFYRNKKTNYTEYKTVKWPRYDTNGKYKTEVYIHTGILRSHKIEARVVSIEGKYKGCNHLYQSENGELWNYTRSPVDSQMHYTFCGVDKKPATETYRLPETIESFVTTWFGLKVFDIYGFEDVTTLIVPKNYTFFGWWNCWKSCERISYIFYEGEKDNITTYGDIEKNAVFMYSENYPIENGENNDYTFWHYIDGKPTIWD